MELVKRFRERGYFSSDLYHFLEKKRIVPNAESLPIVPSAYQKEMGTSTAERFKSLNRFEVDNAVVEDGKPREVKLAITPRVLIFQNYKNKSIENLSTKFCVQNISKAPVYMSILYEESSYFCLKTSGPDLLSRLAPGMAMSFVVTFVPARFGDYVHQVTFKADGVNYVLPIIAIGPRPNLCLPDEINFGKTPLKIEKSINMSVGNVGTTPVSFSLHSRAPFSIEPKSVRYLEPEHKADIKLTLKTMHLGNIEGILRLEMETGEILVIKLLGTTFTVSLQLERQIIRFDDTYNTMVRQQVFKIVNKSEYALSYMIMKNQTVVNDFEDKIAIATVCYDFKNTESSKFAKLEYYDVLSSEEHSRVYTRIFLDQIQALVAEETLQFQNMHFSITPVKGYLWPNKVNEFTITFHPKEIGDFETTCYLDIDGVTDRIPLRIKGTSLPPTIELSVETIDMDCVYINKTYKYEVVATNRGHINGVVVYKPVPVLFNSRITCSPEISCLRPLEKQVFVVSFTNSNQGPFFEEINFLVRDTKLVLKVFLRGTIIYPTLTFNVPCADFGDVSIGIPKTLEFEVINGSETDVRGSIKVNTDGPEINSITLDDCAVNDLLLLELPKWPKEFKIEPSLLEIDPRSKVSIKMTLIANIIRSMETTLELELEKSDSPPIVLPVRYNATVPRITPAPDIYLKVCFIDYTYTEEITIEAKDYYGYFFIDEREDEPAFNIDVGLKRGLITPNSTITFPLNITMRQLGVSSRFIRMFLFGLKDPIEICHITGSCVRPILTVTPLSINWGQVKLLTRTNKTLTIINDSPCYVNYKTSLVNPTTMWMVTPPEGVIDPEEEKDLTVSLCLSDVDSFTNKLLIQFEKVKDIIVPLQAVGVGTSIVVGEHRDHIDLVKHFTKKPLLVTIPIKNCGTKLHTLEWSQSVKPIKSAVPRTAFFNLEPRYFKIGALETAELTISAESKKAVTIKEVWYLIGSVEGINKKEVLMECPIECDFVDQKLEISQHTMTFISSTGPYSEYYKLTDILTIRNKSKLPLELELKTRHPFLIIQKRDTYKILPTEENTCSCIYYDENDLNAENIRKTGGSHPPPVYIDFVTMKPVKPLREGSLRFFEDIYKIKAAFNFTQSIEETLDPDDTMKIQIVFDTTKHNSLRSKIYSDTMKIKFKGLKSKNSVKLVGHINFPNVMVMTPKIDFKCVQNGTIASQCIRIQNVSNLLVCYRFRWKHFCVKDLRLILTKSETEVQPSEFSFMETTTLDQTTLEGSSITKTLQEKERLLSEDKDKLEQPEDLDDEKLITENQIFEESSVTVIEQPWVLKNKTLNLLIPMINYENHNFEKMWIEKLPKMVKYTHININDLFLLTPHRGILKHNEIQPVHIIFKPKSNISVKATLECEVLGGPSEFITIHGLSSDLVYRLSTTRLNFKIRAFFENATEKVLLSNIALLDFNFKIYLNEPVMNTELECLILDTTPSEGTVAAEEEIAIDVNVRPGVMGFFKRQFVLEIGYLPHITIEVIGWGVIPQIYISPQENAPEYKIRCVRFADIEMGYQAIAQLTDEFLVAINEMFGNAEESERCFSKSTSVITKGDMLFHGRLFDDNWHVVTAEDNLPATMDIDMALERKKVIDHFKRNPNIVKEYRHGTRKGPIPDIRIFLYEIDFGVVINGTVAHCSIDIFNYGPVTSRIYLAKYSVIPLWLNLKLCGKLAPGCRGTIEITFSPTPEFFPKMEQSVNAEFSIEIPYGVTIPIHISALCAVPYLKSSVNYVDFGEVKCGDKVIKSIALCNVCKPTCIWHVVLKVFTKGPNPLTLHDSSGKYDPGESGWLKIAFKPTMEMKYEGVLIFKFHMNPFNMTIPVTGQGLVPRVHVIGPNINFPPTLPYAQTSEIYFGITNPCFFPVELIVYHCDKKFHEENDMYEFLQKYYNKPDEMVVPALHPGEPWPHHIIDAYLKFTSEIKRIKDEEVTPRKDPNSKTSRKSPVSKLHISKTNIIKKQRSDAEIISVVLNKMNKEGIDPLKQSCLSKKCFVEKGPNTLSIPRGIIVFFHGSPCEESECYELSYGLGKALRLPTINVDTAIAEAICTCQCTERDIIKGMIDEFYENMFDLFHLTLTETEMNVLTEEKDLDTFEGVQAKLHFYIMNQGAATPRSKGTDKKTGTTSAGKTSMGNVVFGLDLIEALLTEYFGGDSFKRGFVVDSLSSEIIGTPAVLLTTILKCNSAVKNVHLVLCEAPFSKWVQKMEEKLKEQEESEPKEAIYTEDEILKIVEMCENMNAEEYEEAPEDFKAIYAFYGLEFRRAKYIEKYKSLSRIKLMSMRKFPVTTLNQAVEETKSKKEKAGKKEEVKGVKSLPEYSIMANKYNDYYKFTHESLVNVAVNWDFDELDIGSPVLNLTGQPAGGAPQRKVTAPKKSPKDAKEVQVKEPEEIYFENRGFPLTILTCGCIRYKVGLVNMFIHSNNIQSALRKKSVVNLMDCPAVDEAYTVLLPKPEPPIELVNCLEWEFLNESPIKKCECNQYTDLNNIEDSTPENVVNVLTKWHCICGKKLMAKKTSTSGTLSLAKKISTSGTFSSSEKTDKRSPQSDRLSDDFFYAQPLPLGSVLGIKEYEQRIVLEPGDLLRCKYLFHPTEEGKFTLKRYAEVNGWPESRVEINIAATCDIPRIDSRPKKMFANFTRRTLEDKIYKTTYLDDQGIFDFGPIFIGTNRVYEEVYMIDLKNCSLLNVEVEPEFQEDTNVFCIHKNSLTIEPGCKEKLSISAAPATVGIHTCTMLLCIKDNPEIVIINITCSGVVPALELLPETKIIDYESHLLYRRASDRFIIKNNSILPVMWKISNPEDIVEDFLVSQFTGVIPRYENKVVPLTYIACNVGVITNKVLKIDVYDELGRGEPMFSDSLFLSAECYDVTVICAFEDPTETALNFGNVKINSSAYKEMYLFNRGKYNVYYKLKKVKKFPDQKLLKSMESSSEYGLIPASPRPVGIGFQCTPVAANKLANVPAYTCTIIDDTKEQVVVARFPIYISIVTYYNTFTLFPVNELNFHIIPVGSSVLKQVILTNTSVGPFTYDIVVPSQYQRPAGTPQKGKDGKLKLPPIPCGSFLILNDDNLLLPGSSRIISIQFTAIAAQTFEETIQFIVSDVCPEDAQGVPLRLIGTGFVPKLDFWNIETTFKEHVIVKHLSDYVIAEALPHCVFVEDSVTLYFYCVNVNSQHTANIHLYNDGLVNCSITMNLHYQNNTDKDIFWLDKYLTEIDSLMYKKLRITFHPKLLQEYRALLEIKLKVSANEEISFKLCLVGEGVIPRINMMHPSVNQHKLGLLTFPVTCVGSVSHKLLQFKNISNVNCEVTASISQPPYEENPVFWLNIVDACSHMFIGTLQSEKSTKVKLLLIPGDIVKLDIFYHPKMKGKLCCDVRLTIRDNKYESYTVLCEAEAFMEDVILNGLEMLSMEMEIETLKSVEKSITSSGERKKSKSASMDKKKNIKASTTSVKQSEIENEPAELKYLLDFGGCELNTMQKRSVIMVNNSVKVYKFSWNQAEKIMVKPSLGFISPGEEKDLEITFLSPEPVDIKQEILSCALIAITDDFLVFQGPTWDNRQTITELDFLGEYNAMEKIERILSEQKINRTEDIMGLINMHIIWSAVTEFTRYKTTLPEKKNLADTFIYQSRTFQFKVENVGNVPMKIVWSFCIDDEYPKRVTSKSVSNDDIMSDAGTPMPSAISEKTINENETSDDTQMQEGIEEAKSRESLYSYSLDRRSVDTWFEVDLPFKIEPSMECIKPKESRTFKIIFHPKEPFEFKVRLKSSIENLDPYDQNISCNITAKSHIPYVHLDIEESDYLDSNRRNPLVRVPSNAAVLEFNVLGSGCYQKSFNIINPTIESYEFFFEQILNTGIHGGRENLTVPVHCNKLKGFIGGGTSIPVIFTFTPTAAGVSESHWRFNVTAHNVVIDLLVVGIVREPLVKFNPARLMIKHALVGFKTIHQVSIKNTEIQSLKFEFKGSSLCDETGLTPVTAEPEKGILKPLSETPISIHYTPNQDGALSFKIYYKIEHLSKYLTLCVDTMSQSINPVVFAYVLDNEIEIQSGTVNNISLKKTASTYERKITFKIKNQGSATFFYNWQYTCAAVKKFLTVYIEPKTGHVTPGDEEDCVLHFILTQVPVSAYPVTLDISDGPKFDIFLHAEIERPVYHFSRKEFDFGKCLVSAPDDTYKRSMGFTNNDNHTILLNLEFDNTRDIFVDFKESLIAPNVRRKIPIYFRPKEVKEYEFKLRFWVNSLCLEVITIKGEGVPLLFDIREGCQKSFDLGSVKVGKKIVKTIEVINYSKVPIEANFFFDRVSYEALGKDSILHDNNSEGTSICLDPETPLDQIALNSGPSRVKLMKNYNDTKKEKQEQRDIANALSSLKVSPAKITLRPNKKASLNIQFKPVGMITSLNVLLNSRILQFLRPLVTLRGCATDMSLRLSNNFIVFGLVRRRGFKAKKVTLINDGDFSARFSWQIIDSNEFKISPMSGEIAAQTNIMFTVDFRPMMINPFIKVAAICHVENYKSLDLALYATCLESGLMQTKAIVMECPVRDVVTQYVNIVNTTDNIWSALSEWNDPDVPYETVKQFSVLPNTSIDIPIHFKPKTMGTHQAHVLYSPLGESALYVTVTGHARDPQPTGTIEFTVEAKKAHTETLTVYNITGLPEWYIVTSEVIEVKPNNPSYYYEINQPQKLKLWGEAKGTVIWNFICYESCEMLIKVIFTNEETNEYQFYMIKANVTANEIIDVLTFKCRAREVEQKDIWVYNPLEFDADFNVVSEKLIFPKVFSIPKKSQSLLTLIYAPLVVEECEELMSVTNVLKGTVYVYKVVMKCTPAKAKELEYATPIGTRIPLRLRVHNRSEYPVEFTTKISHPSIIPDKPYYPLGPSEKGKFLVWFEPTEVGVQNCVVVFDSPVAGQYEFHIKGIGKSSTPRGPYDILAGSFTSIRFKNIFNRITTFKLVLDNPEFSVKQSYETIKPKSVVDILVYLKDQSTRSGRSTKSGSGVEYPTGVLIIETYDPPDPKVHWSFFLQGK